MTSLVTELFNGLVKGSRAALSKSITLVESTRHDAAKRELVKMANNHLQSKSGHLLRMKVPTMRIAISGSPGSGKSTFIESFGMHILKTEPERKVAVLAIDPSSAITGGSILGDKTRMHNLTRHERAYIRPSPNLGRLGGVGRATNEAIILCETAGYDVVIIETVGVGQSEYQVADLTDIFALLVAPNAGDEIQAIKKGIVELANLIVITKSDGDLVKHARKMSAEFISATKYINIGSKPSVRRISSVTREGIDNVWNDMKEFCGDEEKIQSIRREKRVKLLRSYLLQEIMDRLNVKYQLNVYEEKMRQDDTLILWEVVDDVLGKIINEG